MAPRKRKAVALTSREGVPHDAKMVSAILESMQIAAYEPSLPQQLLEIMHRALEGRVRQVQDDRR